MSKYKTLKKKSQLGMAQGTARNRLVKNLMFSLVKELERDYCYQCGAKIEDIKDFTIEHITPWLDSENPKELYFDLSNIAFSHHSCNVGAARKKLAKCGTFRKYSKGCRCEKCRKANRDASRKYRKKNKGI